MINISSNMLAPSMKLYQQYLRFELSLANNSVLAYMQDILSFQNFLKINLEDVTPNEIISFMATMKKDNASIETILRRLSGISNYYDYLILEGKIKSNPIEFIAKPKKWHKLPSFLDFDDVDKILKAKDNLTPKGIRDGVMIDMLYASGVRVSELIMIKISDVDFKRGIIQVIGKGSKARIVPIYDELMKSLESYLHIRQDYFVKKTDNGFLFLNRFGEHLTRQYVWSWVKEICERAEIKKDVSPHTLRHCFATHLLAGGADLRTIQIFLGHSNIATTEIYTHVADDSKRLTLMNFHPRYK